jgi:hypothetical protein
MTNGKLVLYIPSDSTKLPDNAQWENRFEIHSETSNRVYVVAQNKTKRHWGCSCPGYKIHRTCKHLHTLCLPAYERPFEVKIEGGR